MSVWDPLELELPVSCESPDGGAEDMQKQQALVNLS